MNTFHKGDLSSVFKATGISYAKEITAKPIGNTLDSLTTSAGQMPDADADQTAIQQRQNEKQQKQTDLNLSQRDDGLKSVGRMDVAQSKKETPEAVQKKKERNETNALVARLVALQNDMSGLLDRYIDNQRKIEAGHDILREQDAEAGRAYLEKEFGLDVDTLAGMSDEDIFKAIEERVGELELTQDDLEQQFKDLIREYETALNDPNMQKNPDLLAQYTQKLDELRAEAEKNGLDFEEMLKDVREELGFNNTKHNALAAEAHKTIDKQDFNNAEQVNPNGTDPFAQQSISFAGQNEADPFAAKAEKISDPFNKAAADHDFAAQKNTADITNENATPETEVAITTIETPLKLG